MNTQQAKAIFFAQYFGQKVYSRSDITSRAQKLFVTTLVGDIFDTGQEFFIDNGLLLLRSICQLTNEEKIIIAKLITAGYLRHFPKKDVMFNIENSEVVVVNPNGYKFSKVIFETTGIVYKPYHVLNGDIYYTPMQYQATQLLFRMGILLPFTYIDENIKPVTITPNELIKLKWAKIKKITR